MKKITGITGKVLKKRCRKSAVLYCTHMNISHGTLEQNVTWQVPCQYASTQLTANIKKNITNKSIKVEVFGNRSISRMQLNGGGVPVFATFSDFFFSKKSISERLRGRRMPKIYFWKLQKFFEKFRKKFSNIFTLGTFNGALKIIAHVKKSLLQEAEKAKNRP